MIYEDAPPLKRTLLSYLHFALDSITEKLPPLQ